MAATRVSRGASDQGIEALDHALELYAWPGASWDAGRVRGCPRALGVRRRLAPAERPAEGWDAMTDSELAAVLLVAQGLRNRGRATR